MAILHRTLDENVSYPPHPPRTESAIYVKTHHHLIFELNAPCWVCGIRHTDWPGGLESHHFHFEWASQNGLDLAKVTADWPEITDRKKLAEWIDGELNMLVLCMPGDEPVLMADGTERRLADVHVGDRVIGHDCRAHCVTDTMGRPVDEELVVVDGRRMTANHPVLTSSGWLSAGLLAPGDLALHVGMREPEMFGLRGVQGQVFDPVVLPAAGPVVDAFAAGQSATDVPLHHPDVLHDVSAGAAIPDKSAYVAFAGQVSAEEHAIGRTMFARQRVQRGEAAGVGAVAGPVMARLEGCPAMGAGSRTQRAVGVAAPDGGALARAGGVSVGDARCDQELAIADEACSGDTGLVAHARWRPIEEVGRAVFRGRVHDITVANCHSFVTAGLAVHNCAIHHRAKYEGIHEITYPAWLLQRYQGHDWTFIQQELATTGPRAKVPLLGGKDDGH